MQYQKGRSLLDTMTSIWRDIAGTLFWESWAINISKTWKDLCLFKSRRNLRETLCLFFLSHTFLLEVEDKSFYKHEQTDHSLMSALVFLTQQTRKRHAWLSPKAAFLVKIAEISKKHSVLKTSFCHMLLSQIQQACLHCMLTSPGSCSRVHKRQVLWV